MYILYYIYDLCMILYLEMYTYIYKSRYEQLYIHESIFGEKANTLVMHL